MNKVRITKYNPENRNSEGHYLDKDEWTCFSEVGSKVSIEEYEQYEKAYIDSAMILLKYSEVQALKIIGLEDYENNSTIAEDQSIGLGNLPSVFRSILRNEYWCMLEYNEVYVHFGHDFYMYVGVPEINEFSISQIEANNLYVEECDSPI